MAHNMKKIIFLFVTIIIAFSSCDKGPPPVSVTINAITVNSFPQLNPYGDEWDVVDGADLYFAINEGDNPGNFLLVSSTYYENSTVPVNFTHGFPYTIGSIRDAWTLSLWNYDNGNDDDIVSAFSFIPNDYYVKGRNTITLTNNSGACELNVTWNY